MTGKAPAAGGEDLGRDFWVYRAGRTVSAFGDSLGFIAFSQWVLDTTGSAASMTSIVAPATVVRLFIMPLVGPLGDRIARKKLVLAGDALQAAIWVLMAAAAFRGSFSIPLFTAFYILAALGQGLYAAGDTAMLPQIVSKENLSAAVKQRAALQSVVSVVSGAAAGVLVSVAGTRSSFLLNAASFVIALGFTALIRSDTAPGWEEGRRPRLGLKQWALDIWEGVAFLRDSRVFFWVVVVAVLINAAANPMFAMLAVYAKSFDVPGAGLLGALRSATGLGSVAGAFYLKQSRSRHGNDTVLNAGLLLFAAAAGLLCVTPSWQPALAAAFLLGTSQALSSIPLSVQVAHTVPNRLRARFGTTMTFMCGISAPAGLFLAGLLSDRLGIRWVMAAMGGWVLLCAPLMYLMPSFIGWLRGEITFGEERAKA